MYLGSSGMKAQMKYADKRNSPCAIIQGSDERAKGEVTIKDLIEGAKAAAAIKDNKEWKEARPAQFSVPEANLVEEVRKLIARHQAVRNRYQSPLPACGERVRLRGGSMRRYRCLTPPPPLPVKGRGEAIAKGEEEREQ